MQLRHEIRPMKRVHPGRIRHETVLWCVFFVGWLSANVFAYWAFAERELADAEKRGVPRSVLRYYRAGEWSGRSELQSSDCWLAYRVHEPKHVTTPQPLLLFLHGAGRRGADNVRQLESLPAQLSTPEWQARYHGFILVPQCPAGRHWNQELPSLIGLVEQWRNDPRVDKRRIYVTGLSMGGYGTWRLVKEKAEWFAAAVPICGGGDPDAVAKFDSIPIWAIHGDADNVVPVTESRNMIQALRKYGASPRYSELRDVGHDCWTEAYQDPEGVLAWMLEQRNDRCVECR